VTVLSKDTGYRFLMKIMLVVLAIATTTIVLPAKEIHVRPGEMKPGVAIRSAKPGDSVIIHPGEYRGGEWIKGVSGTSEKVITIRAADPKSPPVISGGLAGWQFSACSHLVIEDVVFQHQTDNGLNIDDNDQYQSGNLYAATDIRLNRIVIRDLNAEENNDGIKLSGLRNFSLTDCRISNWGKVGCAVDMVSCVDGQIVGIMADGCNQGGWGIQAKGGSSNLLVQDCQIKNVTQRGIQIGGVTSPDSFREKDQDWEARGIEVKSCDVYGGDASIAIIHARGVSIQNCRWIYPKKWFFRFLNENPSRRFQPSGNVLIEGCLCVANGNSFIGPVNSGIGLNDDSVRFADNIWFHENFPKWDLRLGLPCVEDGGVSGIEPPGSFLRDDFVFTESRFEQLRSLLYDEIILKVNDNRMQWILTLGLVSLMWFGLWIHSIGCNPVARSTLQMKSQAVVNSQRLRLMLAFLLVVIHIDLNLLGINSESDFPTAVTDGFERLYRSIQLGCAIFLIKNLLDGIVERRFDSIWTSIICGVIVALAIYGIDSLVCYRSGRIAYDRNHLFIDITVGFFSGVIAYGFTRNIRAFTVRRCRSAFSSSKVDGLLLTLCLLALFTSFIFRPLTFNVEYFYDRFGSYALNIGTFTRQIDVCALNESLLFCVPFTWAMANQHTRTLNGICVSLSLVTIVVVLLQFMNVLRTGRHFLLSQTCLTALFSFATWFAAHLVYQKHSTPPGKFLFFNMVVKIKSFFVVVPWILLFWVA
jgi:hypothetical protein